MTRWEGHTTHADVAPGTRLLIIETMYSGGSRPPYFAGEEFRVQLTNGPLLPGRIVAVGGNRLTVEVEGRGHFELAPTPRNALPPALRMDIPSEDWSVVSKVEASADDDPV